MQKLLGTASALLLMISGLGAGAAHAATLYGVTGDGAATSESLFTLDTSNASATFVRAFGNGDDGEVIATNPNDGLIYHGSGWGVPNDPVAGEVFESFDPGTLGVSQITLSGDDYDEARGLTWDAVANAFLLADRGNRLYSLTSGGVASFIGNMDHQSKGMAYGGSTLFSIENNNPNLHTLDATTGATLTSTAITLAGETVNGATGLAWDPDTDVLFALLKLDFQSTRELVTLDPQTGVATSIGDTGDKFAGLAFAAAPIPEPSTALLLAAGLIGLGCRRSHRIR